MAIKVLKNDENIYIVELQNELDLFSSNMLKELVMKMVEKKIERFIIDLKKTETITSAGLGALVYVSSTAKKMDFALAFTNINEAVKKAIDITKLTGYFPITPTLKEAVELVRSQPRT
ncbi:STAS domain-containing protein [Leadbettera azotonutricia]|uniref:Anti-sigma factor antagonist n=1 Tax=Leadbettera azotonutricia (strain ATCC BAA-888 / DSM 13862 / ZAS-9) TaxID=545695 RepID=F5YAE1_LEAAZ|nr:STAS domain-containing protein [Leadbettera azotonutricia]AEF80069.1 anti-anti-sigma factor [Leadbettera azotonutricia ZAS-9]